MDFPTISQLRKGIQKFRRYEKRDAMYKVATRIIHDYWGKPEEVTDGLGVLLLTWNQALYRYGPFDFSKLEKFIRTRSSELNYYRNKNILNWNKNDDAIIKIIFDELIGALASISKNGKLRRSPVAVSKALHLLAPSFFPLWDNAIAKEYRCYWYNYNKASDKYLLFFQKILDFCKYLNRHREKDRTGKTSLKIIDEYNYAEFTLKNRNILNFCRE